MSCPDPLYDYEDFDGVEGCDDDGYDAAVDAYLLGYGPAITSKQLREEEELRDEYRHNGW